MFGGYLDIECMCNLKIILLKTFKKKLELRSFKNELGLMLERATKSVSSDLFVIFSNSS